MHEWQSQSHVRWDCKYHVVIVPKYRKKLLYGKLRNQVGPILRELCRQRGVEVIEGHVMPDHVHMCLSIPPKYSVAFVIALPEGQERGADPPPGRRAAAGGAALLVGRVLREYRRAG